MKKISYNVTFKGTIPTSVQKLVNGSIMEIVPLKLYFDGFSGTEEHEIYKGMDNNHVTFEVRYQVLSNKTMLLDNRDNGVLTEIPFSVIQV